MNKINNFFPSSTWLSISTHNDAQYGTYKEFLILFTNIEIHKNKIIATDVYLNEDKFVWVIGKSEGISYLGDNKYEIDKKMFVPLKVINSPKYVNVGDYFTSSNFRTTHSFKKIKSFSKNPWSDLYNGFDSNGSYHLFRAFGEYRGGYCFFLKNNAKLTKALAGGQYTIV